MGELQRMALRHQVAILVLHHTRKQPGDDAYDEVSGSTGLTGAADTSMVLQRKRTERAGILHLTGRDVEEQELAVDFDKETCTWTLLGPAADHRKPRPVSRLRQEILDLLQEKGGAMTPKEVAEALGKSENVIRQGLKRMAEDSLVLKEGYGRYRLPSPQTSLFGTDEHVAD